MQAAARMQGKNQSLSRSARLPMALICANLRTER